MDNYDDTNSGAAFKIFDKQKMILQGKLNIEGSDRRIVLVADETRNGTRLIEVYQKIGAFFENDSDNERAPNYTGPMEDYISDKKMNMSGWKHEKDGRKYLSIKISPKQDSNGEYFWINQNANQHSDPHPTSENSRGLKPRDLGTGDDPFDDQIPF